MGYVFVALTVLLTVGGQLLIKLQVDRAGGVPAGVHGQLQFVAGLLAQPLVLLGLAMAFGAALSWMLALTRLPLSKAYPFTALALVLVVACGAWLFAEPIGALRMAGVALVCIGVVLVGLQ